jgi:hypothetical protein
MPTTNGKPRLTSPLTRRASGRSPLAKVGVEWPVRRHALRLEKGANAAAGVPERKHFDLATAETIVKVVMNSREMHALYPFRLDIQCGCANAGFRTQKRKRLRKFFVQGVRSKRAILVPPKRSAINVPLRSLRDPNFHGLSAVTTSQPREHLFGRNRFPSICLGDRKEQLGLLLRGQSEAAFVVFGQNSHRRAFFQRHALDYDLTPDDFSSSDLHRGKNTPIQRLSWTDAERHRSAGRASGRSPLARIGCNGLLCVIGM